MSRMEEDTRKLDRTWLCSVLFLDIVNYSSEPVETQVHWKAFFNSCLSEALLSVLVDDRIILDTGDGAVVCFLGDPEAALLSSLSILNQFRNQSDTQKSAAVRVGINLGPIRLIRDINNQMNAIGDGINVGQRIMSFAGGNQLLISRSYYEVISTLSANYKSLFRFDGVRHDKHVREHTVYALVQEHEGANHPPVLEPSAPVSLELSLAFRPEDLSAIEKKLSSFVGPIATHLVKRASTQTRTLTDLCEMLAEASVPPVDRRKFLDCCRELAGTPTQSAFAQGEGDQEFTPGPTLPSPQKWDPALLEKLRKELANFVGPIASVLITRATKNAASVQELYSQLASQIASEKDRQKFLSGLPVR